MQIRRLLFSNGFVVFIPVAALIKYAYCENWKFRRWPCWPIDRWEKSIKTSSGGSRFWIVSVMIWTGAPHVYFMGHRRTSRQSPTIQPTVLDRSVFRINSLIYKDIDLIFAILHFMDANRTEDYLSFICRLVNLRLLLSPKTTILSSLYGLRSIWFLADKHPTSQFSTSLHKSQTSKLFTFC